MIKVFGVKAETSFLELGPDSLEVGMGAWFHETFPLSAISAMGPSEWPWWGGIGVKIHHHGVGVIGTTDNIVCIQFSSPQKAKVLATVESEQIWLSPADRDGFLKALSEATKVPISEHIPF